MDGFSSAEGVSWLSIPGQLALTSRPLDHPIRSELSSEGGHGAYGLTVADIDDDGDVDIFGTSDAQRGILLWLNEGGSPPTFQRRVIDSDFPGGTSLAVADIDRDGDLDLVGAAQNPGNKVAWWRNDEEPDAEWQRLEIDHPFPVACNVSVADVNGDGWPDVLSTSWTVARLNVWYHSGTDPVEWTEQTIAYALRGAHSAVAGDVDGDGDLDVVGTGANDSEVLLLVNRGGEPVEWESVVVGNDLDGVRYAAFADVDSDGRLDIVAAAADGQVVMWRNGGSASVWERHLIDDSCHGGHWVAVNDVDGDGRNDVIVAAYVAANFFWYRQGAGSLAEWTRFELDEQAFAAPLTVIAADLDGRGDLELVGADWEPGFFYWWEVSEFVPSGELLSRVVRLDQNTRSVRVAWQAETPAATNLTVEWRSGSDMSSLGGWQEVSESGAEAAVIGEFFQYRLRLTTTDPTVSPIVRSIRLTTPVSGEETAPRIDEPTLSD
jgi:hypothetical protein